MLHAGHTHRIIVTQVHLMLAAEKQLRFVYHFRFVIGSHKFGRDKSWLHLAPEKHVTRIIKPSFEMHSVFRSPLVDDNVTPSLSVSHEFEWPLLDVQHVASR